MSLLVENIRKWALFFSSIIFFCIVAINVTNLLWRWTLGESLSWILEISLILIVYSVLFCVPALYAGNNLIQMFLVEGYLKKRGMDIYLSIFVEIAILVFLVYMIPKSYSLSMKQVHILSRGIGIPRIYVTIPVLISVSLCLVINVNKQISLFKKLIGNWNSEGNATKR